jgi:hypothetical protein
MPRMIHFFYTPYDFRTNSYDIYEVASDEIVKYAARHLGRRIPIHIAPFSAGRVTVSPDDILIGHTPYDLLQAMLSARDDASSNVQLAPMTNNWIHDNALSPDARFHPNTFIFVPWDPGFPHEASDPKHQAMNALYRDVAGFMPIAGEIWEERADPTLLANMTRVNMGCEARIFTPKRRYHPPPYRNLLHMSAFQPKKRIDILLSSVFGVKCQLHIASAKLAPGQTVIANDYGNVTVSSLGQVGNFDPGFNSFVDENIDFYIHTSQLDAQSTVILENCARGIVPLVTPESGFRCPYAIDLTLDPIKNREIVAQAIEMPKDEYEWRSRGVRAHVEAHHNWEGIYDRVWEAIVRTVG